MKRALFLIAVVGCHSSPRSSEPLSLEAGGLRVTMPARASGVMRIERSAGVFLDVRSSNVGDGPAKNLDSHTVTYDHGTTRITHVASDGRIEELRHVERDAQPLAFRVRLGPGLAQLRVVGDIVEALDLRGVALLRTEPAFLVDAVGNRRDLKPSLARDEDGWSLTWPVNDEGLTYPLEIDPAWTLTTSLSQPRRNNSLHLLPSGKVVTLGGATVTKQNLSLAEAWDPATKSWTSAGTLQRPRAYHTAATLPGGKIVVAGGFEPGTENTAEVYDPATQTSTMITATSPKTIGLYARSVAISTTQVMVAFNSGSALLDVAAGTWTDTPFVVNRDEPRITLLAAGKVLLVGGDLSDAEVFDPSTKKWTSVAPTKVARHTPEITTLLTGKALVAGGTDSTAEIYDPVGNTWTLTPPMSIEHSFSGLALLTTGKALILGGDIAAGLTDRVEIYDPIANTWSLAGKLSAPIDDFGWVALGGGKALVAGGSNGVPIATTQLFEPEANGKRCIGPGECTSGFCVDGACCEKSSCAANETCGGSGGPGTCLKKDAVDCANDNECGSGHCADGVCCESACTEQCAACNISGSAGKCVAVPAGDSPHGARGSCPGEGVCRGRCGGIDKARCTQFPGTPVICAEAACTGGQESHAVGCDGAGACAVAKPRACAPYVCGKTACRTDCDVDSDCVEGNSCDLVTRSCVIAATCDGESSVKSPAGIVQSCVPFRCDTGHCLDACNDTSACSAGFVCDVATTRCVLASGPESGSGGCSVGTKSAPIALTLAALAGLLWVRRRGTWSMR